nr:MAG TPA: hypothetical protein [Bacteriophage sp.]
MRTEGELSFKFNFSSSPLTLTVIIHLLIRKLYLRLIVHPL